jgi:hypothetical protein
VTEQPTSEQATAPLCPRCNSPRWVSVSLDGGWTRRAQCVPCGALHEPVIGPGFLSRKYGDPEAEHPAYRTKQAKVTEDTP